MTTAEQLIFTSCRYARGGGSGFQVKSLSPGLSALDVNKIVQRSDYQRPVPTDGVVAEAAADCPVAVRWYALPSGGWALTRMVYVGTDYTGRPGNFLAHTLAFAADEAGRIDPIAWLDWDGWLDALPPGSDDSPDVPALAPARWIPAAPLHAPPLPAGANAALLARALAAMFEAAATRRALVMLTTANENVEWLRLLSCCLPLSHVAQTEFSSYEHNLRRLPALAMTVDGTAIDAQSDRQNGFVCANLIDASREPVSDAAGLSYGKTVARIVFECRELLPRFIQLLRRVTLGPGADLAAMAQVFMLIEAGEEPDTAPLNLLRFVFVSRADPSFAALVPRLLVRIPPIVPESFADRVLLAQAWAGSIASGRHDEQRPVAVRAFLHVLLAAVPHWPSDEATVDQLRDALFASLGSTFDELMLQSVRRDLTAVRSAFLAASPAGATELLRFVSELGVTSAPEMDAMVHALIPEPRAAERLEALVVLMPDTKSRAAVFEMAGRASAPLDQTLASLLGKVLHRANALLPADKAAELRAIVPIAVLLAEWESAHAESDPITAGDKLCKAYDDPRVRHRLSSANRITKLVIAARAFARVNATDRLFAELKDAEKQNLLAEISQTERAQWATLINDRLRLDVPIDADVQARIDLLKCEMDRLNVVLRPDRGALITVLAALGRGQKPTDFHLTMLADLDAVSEPERRYASAKLLEFAFRELPSQPDGGGLHVALMIGPLRQIGHDIKAYRESLAQLVGPNDASAVSALISWWLLDSDSESANCERLWSSVARDLATTACRIDAASAMPIIGPKFAAATCGKVQQMRLEQWLKAYKADSDIGLLRAAYRRVSRALTCFGRKKS